MDLARALIDRELAVSGFLHDLRGPVTALSGVVEMGGAGGSPALRLAYQRTRELSEAFARPFGTPRLADLGPPLGQPEGFVAAVLASPSLLALALAELPNERVAVHLERDAVAVLAHGVPASEGSPAWSLARVQAWMEEGGEGLAGARVRIAARLLGAVHQSFRLEAGMARGVLTLHFGRPNG